MMMLATTYYKPLNTSFHSLLPAAGDDVIARINSKQGAFLQLPQGDQASVISLCKSKG